MHFISEPDIKLFSWSQLQAHPSIVRFVILARNLQTPFLLCPFPPCSALSKGGYGGRMDLLLVTCRCCQRHQASRLDNFKEPHSSPINSKEPLSLGQHFHRVRFCSLSLSLLLANSAHGRLSAFLLAMSSCLPFPFVLSLLQHPVRSQHCPFIGQLLK